MSIEARTLAWVISVVTALVFVFLAHRAHRNWFAWAFAGWMLGIVIATIILGLSEAAFIPVSPTAYVGLHLKATVVTAILVAAGGAIFVRTASGKPGR